jgi:hypothetical protein
VGPGQSGGDPGGKAPGSSWILEILYFCHYKRENW